MESSQTEKVTEEQEVATESTDSPSKNKSSDKHQEENVTGTKSDYIQAAKSSELEESAEMQGNDKNEQKSKDDNIQDTESPIRLILEEDDNFHDDEVQVLRKLLYPERIFSSALFLGRTTGTRETSGGTSANRYFQPCFNFLYTYIKCE